MAPELKKEPLNAEEVTLLHQKMRELAVLGNIVDGFTYQTISRCLVTIEAKDAEIANGEAAYWELHAGLTARIGELESKDWQRTVQAWHEKFGVVVGDSPAIRRPDLRAALIIEEARETCEAILRGDLVEAIDGMCDVIYVVCGTAVEFGIDLTPFFAEVHRTNMAKEGGSTRADGKILKPPGWTPPRIAEMLAQLLARKENA